jgi:hypothetical protein
MALLCFGGRGAGVASQRGNVLASRPQSRPAVRAAAIVVRAKLTQQQRHERVHLENRKSEHGTPIVDWLLETSPYSTQLSEEAIEDLRERERKISEIDDVGERLRRLRIAFANKNRRPWNAGKRHRPGAYFSHCAGFLHTDRQSRYITLSACCGRRH